MPQHRGTPVLQNMVLATWTQGPWIAKYLECHHYSAWVRSEPARGRSASSYEAADNKQKTQYNLWSIALLAQQQQPPPQQQQQQQQQQEQQQPYELFIHYLNLPRVVRVLRASIAGLKL